MSKPTWSDIEDGQGGASVASKINNAISWLLDQFPFNFFWETDPEDSEYVRTLDDKKVKAPKVESDFIEVNGTLNSPTINADFLTVNDWIGTDSLHAAGNFRVESDGKMFIDDLAPSPAFGQEILPLLVDTDGRVRTSETVDRHDLTFNFSASLKISVPSDGYSGVLRVLDGLGQNHWIPFTNATSVVLENVAEGEGLYTIELNEYQNVSGSFTLAGDKTITINVQPLLEGYDPITPPESRRAIYEKTSNTGEFTREYPMVIVEREENHTRILPDASENKHVEFGARKSKLGGALTISGSVVMDDEEKDVLTTTVKGAWVKLKSLEVDHLWKWVVVQDSGDWTLDNI